MKKLDIQGSPHHYELATEMAGKRPATLERARVGWKHVDYWGNRNIASTYLPKNDFLRKLHTLFNRGSLYE